MIALYVVGGAVFMFGMTLIVALVDRLIGHGHRSNPRTESLRRAEMEYLTRQNHM
jgi:hypothetical protein